MQKEIYQCRIQFHEKKLKSCQHINSLMISGGISDAKLNYLLSHLNERKYFLDPLSYSENLCELFDTDVEANSN